MDEDKPLLNIGEVNAVKTNINTSVNVTDQTGLSGFGNAADKLAGTATGLVQRICYPAAEEFGLMLGDSFGDFRRRNFEAIAKRAKKNIEESHPGEDVSAPPRLIASVIEKGSWEDDQFVQDLWAGLLSSSCTEEGDDDSNLLFINILANLTKLQAHILNHACIHAKKIIGSSGVTFCMDLRINLKEYGDEIGEKDFHRLDREIDNLRSSGLLTPESSVEINNKKGVANVTPSTLGLHMFVRCQGSRIAPYEYFKGAPEIITGPCNSS
ncbi:MAG: DUF4393 domain-containing protein [Planctomycetaceae bacterium]|nr:DUF4393 domain-containing protein [Planctomycetaceae bacterium]